MPTASHNLDKLTADALDVAKNAYAPYSGFRVGAALLLSNGEVVTGVNVENASYGLTICAERGAIMQAIARFGPEIRVLAAAVVNLNKAASPPCGACRQVLSEFMSPDAPFRFPSLQNGSDSPVDMLTLRFDELLPHTFHLHPA